MRLTLLRGPIRPDPVSDLGVHEFTYSLLPHAGDWRAGGTARAAMTLNNPLLPVAARRHAGASPPRHSYARVEGDGVFLGALKAAERGGGAIVRVAELHGGRIATSIGLPGLRTARECDFIECNEGKTRVHRETFTTRLQPFQIRSFRLDLRANLQKDASPRVRGKSR